MSQGFTKDPVLDNDPTLAANSQFMGVTQYAVKTYIDNHDQPIAVTTQTADYTLVLADAWSIIEVDDTGSFIEITIPLNSSVAFPVGTLIWLNQKDVAQCTVLATVGVTIESPDSYVSTRVQGSTIRLQKVATDTWELAEDLGVFIGYDADATALFDAMAAGGDTLTTDQKSHVNVWFLAAKANGYYSKYHAVYLMVGGTATAHKWNAVDPQDTDAAFRMVFTGSPTHDANGVTFNGTTQYGNTKLLPSAVLGIDSKHYSVYLRNTASGAAFSASNNITQCDQINLNAGGTSYINVSKAGATVAAPATRTRTWQLDRSSGTNTTTYRDGSLLLTDAGASVYNPAFAVYCGARNFNGTADSFSAANVAFFAIGDSFSSGERSSEQTDIDTLQTALSRNV